ncbi:MAG: hypothetical protein Fur007_06030 [Rhodoferax sp.]
MQTLLGRWPIGWRLAVSSGASVLLFGLFTVWLWLSLGGLRQDASRALTDGVQWALLAKDMQRNVVQVQQFLSDISATRALDGLDDGFAQAQANQQSFLQGLQRFEQRAQAAGDSAMLQRLGQIRTRFDAYYRLGVDMAKAYVDLGPAGGNLHMEAFDKASAALQDEFGALVEAQVKQLAQSSQTTLTRTRQIQVSAVGVVALAAALLVGLGWLAARSILTPLAQGVAVAERVAEGNLTEVVETGQRDELSRLLRALGQMQTRLGSVIARVRQGSDNLASATAQIAQGNHELSGRTEAQADALQRTRVAVEQLAAAVNQNADSARQAHTLAQTASSVAQQGGQVVSDAVQTMHDINQPANA